MNSPQKKIIFLLVNKANMVEICYMAIIEGIVFIF